MKRRLVLTLAACAGGWWLGTAAPTWVVGAVSAACVGGLALLVCLPDPLGWLDGPGAAPERPREDEGGERRRDAA